MKYRVIDGLCETGEQDEVICGKLVGVTESMWQAKRIMYEYEDECATLEIPCDVQIYDETDRMICSYE